jgi:RP/EB family microtubule-associated protein
MNRVTFNANQEYQYVNNFKILQTAFAVHHVDKPIPVERLVKLKFQDNLVRTQQSHVLITQFRSLCNG